MPNDTKRRSPTTPDDATGSRAAIASEIAAAVAEGGSLRKMLDASRPAHWPDRSSYWRWQFDDPKLRAELETALRVRAVVQAEEIPDIVDETPQRIATAFGTRIDPGFVAWQKTRADTRMEIASRMAPKLYGQRVTHAGDAENPIEVTSRDAKRSLLGRLAALAPAEENPRSGGEAKR